MRGDDVRVLDGFVTWLAARGWTVRTDAGFVDVVAERDGQLLYAEAEGATTTPGLDVNAAIGQLLSRMPTDAPHATFALVVRDEPESVEAAARVPQRVLELLNIALYAVDETGAVRQLPGRV
ncbi:MULTISPECIES: hypothetical protein [Rhodococcus]|uniref:hypothetical protein n=1 Tax=Rhodococcus TaxID=1827 RepID=UPI00135B4B4B|nr:MULTISPECIES: hypothetical protein [Rhodococcus]KAF0956761.1 hypothetical protein MLGJGCBP_10169 [Rhodococcus sp. T7]KAF0966582.1 hypothetical protein MLGJGCBP_00257 [Rhodococcus sp. T7]UOT08346.1 hypothetical protein MPY17_39300 [Rhodococcus opacus]